MTHTNNTPLDWQDQWKDLTPPLALPHDRVPQGSIIQIQGKDAKGYFFLAEPGRTGLKAIALERGWKPGRPIRFQTSPHYWARSVHPQDHVSVVSVPTEHQIRSSEERRVGKLVSSEQHRSEMEERIRERSTRVHDVLQRTMSPADGDRDVKRRGTPVRHK